MSAWHALIVVNTVLLIAEMFRGDWLIRRIDRIELRK